MTATVYRAANKLAVVNVPAGQPPLNPIGAHAEALRLLGPGYDLAISQLATTIYNLEINANVCLSIYLP